MFSNCVQTTTTTTDPEWASRLKKSLWKGTQSPEEAFKRLQEAIDREVRLIREASDRDQSVIPEVSFSDIQNGSVPSGVVAEIRKRGTAIVRGVVPSELAETWAKEAESYVNVENDYHGTSGKQSSTVADAKNFFAEETPQIYGVYWNKPQMRARQHPNMQIARAWLNSLWSNVASANGEWRFDTSKETTYADRQRIRLPGNVSGLVPHVDGGSIEVCFNIHHLAFIMGTMKTSKNIDTMITHHESDERGDG